MGRPDPPSLVAGIALVAFGAGLLMSELEVIDLRLAVLAPVVCATIGCILVALGMSRRA